MSIRPVDHNTLIPKTQEIAQNRQIESTRQQNLLQSQYKEQDKTIKENMSKVLDTGKSESTRVNDENDKESQEYSGNKKKHKGKKEKKDTEKHKKKNIGSNIDIRI